MLMLMSSLVVLHMSKGVSGLLGVNSTTLYVDTTKVFKPLKQKVFWWLCEVSYV